MVGSRLSKMNIAHCDSIDTESIRRHLRKLQMTCHSLTLGKIHALRKKMYKVKVKKWQVVQRQEDGFPMPSQPPSATDELANDPAETDIEFGCGSSA